MRSLSSFVLYSLLLASAQQLSAQPLQLGMSRESVLALARNNPTLLIIDTVTERDTRDPQPYERLRIAPYRFYGWSGLASILIDSSGSVYDFSWRMGETMSRFHRKGFEKVDSIFWVPAPGDFEVLRDQLQKLYGEAAFDIDGYRMSASWTQGERVAFLNYNEGRLTFIGTLDTTEAGGEDGTTMPVRSDLYDESVSGDQQIAAALAQAAREKKNVLLQFGANWCGWCHKLHRLFETDAQISENLQQNYVVVLVDVNKTHNEDIVQRYDNPVRHGLPVIVVLDSTGTMLTTQDTGKLEKGKEHDPAKVLAFLRKWAPR